MDLVTLEQILQAPGHHAGWLYLPAQPWGLATQGVFALDDKDADPADDPTPQVARQNHWQEVLDSDTIEDIVANARAQIPNSTLQQLLEAFVYYVEQDAFIRFDSTI
ncbi:hypothetical protein [Pseudomonas sp. NPDC089401]|uniref:DUF7716 domain-containing protein n=1 Tax=Pseudomonas sp. NPDC089401 TaxID=3364462 RepID=UPI0037F63A8B